MSRKLLIVLFLLFAAISVHAATMLDVTGPSPFGFANQSVIVTAWTQAGTYSNVTITAPLEDNSSGGPIGGVEGVVYLTNAIGPGATSANNVAPPVSISGLTNTFTTQALFSGLTLGPGNYYLVFASTNSNPLSMSAEGASTPVVTTGTAIFDLGADAAITAAPFPPATSGLSLSPPSNIFVTVTGDLVSVVVPTMDTWALLLLICMLSAIGVVISRR